MTSGQPHCYPQYSNTQSKLLLAFWFSHIPTSQHDVLSFVTIINFIIPPHLLCAPHQPPVEYHPAVRLETTFSKTSGNLGTG